MCVIDRAPVRTDCLSRSETTADGAEEHGCIDAADVKHVILLAWNLGTLEPTKNPIRSYLQTGRWAQRGEERFEQNLG